PYRISEILKTIGMRPLTKEQNIYYALRIASAMCFIGHGTFGIITKEIWCNYFGVFGISHDTAYHLMPLLGSIDVLMGLSLLIYPTRVILGWLVIWGIITAMLRPLSGEPFAEFIERAGNFGAPLTLLILCWTSTKNTREWFTLVKPSMTMNAKLQRRVTLCLQVIVFLLLTGHGWLNLIEKKGILSQYAALGFSDPAATAHIIGIAEIAMALMVLIRPIRPLVFIFLVWKMGSELFYPHWEFFEWVERGGSYGTLLALWFVLPGISLRRPYKISTT
ncbi:MAG TPA: hypothetical protein VHC47_07405, partial [Mucilaginibacter sp.]|nr:hypothetical protein [Mucilaginibacter sp.]